MTLLCDVKSTEFRRAHPVSKAISSLNSTSRVSDREQSSNGSWLSCNYIWRLLLMVTWRRLISLFLEYSFSAKIVMKYLLAIQMEQLYILFFTFQLGLRFCLGLVSIYSIIYYIYCIQLTSRSTYRAYHERATLVNVWPKKECWDY